MTSKRADDDDLYVVEESKDHIADFSPSIGPAYNRWTAEDEAGVIEVDLSVLQDFFTFVVISTEFANACEQRFEVVVHGVPLDTRQQSMLYAPVQTGGPTALNYLYIQLYDDIVK